MNDEAFANLSRKRPSSPVADRIPPNNVEAERGLIGCLLLEARWVLDRMMEVCSDPMELFYDLRHREIAEALTDLMDAKKPTDIGALVVKLDGDGRLETVGGYAYLSGCMDAVPSSRNAGYYLEMLGELLSKRRLINACTQVVAEAYEGEKDIHTLLDGAEASVLGATQKVSRAGDAEASTAEAMVISATKYCEELMKERRELSGMWMDDLGFWLPGNMVVIGARPKVGKTTLALNIIAAACSRGIPCGMLSLEMTKEQVTLRMAATEAEVDISQIYSRRGLEPCDYEKLSGAFGRISQFPFYCDDRGGLNIYQIRTAFRKMHAKRKIQLGVLDYMQLVAGTGREDRSEAEIARISTGMKGLAKELGIPIIVVSQLNRGLERDNNRQARASDNRGSGQIEADADVMLLAQTNPNPPEDSARPSVDMIVALNRHGPSNPGKPHKMILNAKILRFEEPSYESIHQDSVGCACKPYAD